MNIYPLVVDLDGTLIHTDILHESLLRVLHHNPLHTFSAIYWLSQGKAVLKQQLADRITLDLTTLPYNQDLLTFLKSERESGRKLILCTASHKSIADEIASHLNLFDEVMASDGEINLSGKHKAKVLVERFGQNGFDYAGNSTQDLPVWEVARQAVLVNTSPKLTKTAQEQFKVAEIFPPLKTRFKTWAKVLRVHQWLKNLLLFIPLLAAHELLNMDLWLILISAFFAFSLCASSVYIVNDLLDLESDRQHLRKRKRPFASGELAAWKGIVLAPLLLAASFALAYLTSQSFFFCLATYFVITTAYSFRLKKLILVDSLTLAILYTIRIISGNVAIQIPLSYWLLAFSIFLFLSLAFVKRYAELQLKLLSGTQKIHGRGYHTSDAPLIQMFGVAAGYVAILILALYINSDAVIKLYQAPEFVWGAVPITLFWISWMWMQAHRGNMHDDPLVFAVKDKVSLFSGLLFAITLAIGAVGLA